MTAVINSLMKNSVLKSASTVKRLNLKDLLPPMVVPSATTDYHNMQINEKVSKICKKRKTTTVPSSSSLVFEIDMVAGMFSLSQQGEGNDMEDKWFEGFVTPAIEEVKTLLTKKTNLEIEVEKVVNDYVRRKNAPISSIQIEDLCDFLKECEFEVAIVGKQQEETEKKRDLAKIRVLKHKFIICYNGESSSSSSQKKRDRHDIGSIIPEPRIKDDNYCIIIDPKFKEQFEILNPTYPYEALIKTLPNIFVGSELKLEHSIHVIVSEMAKVFSEKQKFIPPWRMLDATIERWKPLIRDFENKLEDSITVGST